jgi:copper chaperone CopZ
MMCEEACAARVRDILAGQTGVKEVTVDFDAKTATCLIDGSTFDPADAIAELDDKDFAASVQE